jgi:hypothetical protein
MKTSKKQLAELVRQESFASPQEQEKALKILHHPKTKKLWEEEDEGLCTLLLSECAYTYFMPLGEPPVLWRDRDELKRQAKAARDLHDKVKNLVEDVVSGPNKTAMVKGSDPAQPHQTDAEILLALDKTAVFLQRELQVPKRKSSDWRKYYLFERLDIYLRYAGLKGKILDSMIAALVEATFDTPIKISSVKPLVSRARSMRRRVDDLRKGNR